MFNEIVYLRSFADRIPAVDDTDVVVLLVPHHHADAKLAEVVDVCLDDVGVASRLGVDDGGFFAVPYGVDVVKVVAVAVGAVDNFFFGVAVDYSFVYDVGFLYDVSGVEVRPVGWLSLTRDLALPLILFHLNLS